jgi:FtsH-binding integral membrane protein
MGLRESRNVRTACQHVLGTACDGRYVPAVADRPSRYFYFDLARFVTRPDTLSPDPTRDYFLNRVAKSSLIGVAPLGEELTSKRHRALSAVMSALLLVMVAACAAAAPFLQAAHVRKYRVYFVTSIITLVFLVAFRARAPNEFHEDFRHIYPALVPFCLAYAAVVAKAHRKAKALGWAGLAVGIAMVASSAAFFLRVF